jgi:phosphoribosylaminoimidazole (AIR) synthetase
MDKDYMRSVVKKGDEGSRLLAELCAPTLDNTPYLARKERSMGGVNTLLFPDDKDVLIFSAAGDNDKEGKQHAASLVERLIIRAEIFNAEPVGFANVIDSSTGDLGLLACLAEGMVSASNKHGVAILNGENAILGDRVKSANMVGTLIALIPKGMIPYGKHHFPSAFSYAVIPHNGRLVAINSDGVGSKCEIYERKQSFSLSLFDSLAMKLDDAARINAETLVVSDILETRGEYPKEAFRLINNYLERELGIIYLIDRHDVGERISGYGNSVFHLGGSAVSLLPEKFPSPHEGDLLLALQKSQNPRSNGLTEKRRIMTEIYGKDWHKDGKGKEILAYLSMPSTIFYPTVRELFKNNAATAFFHMSGGALDGKLARPLANLGLYAEISNLFEPPPEEIFLMQHSGKSVQDWFAISPMGNEAYITTDDEAKAAHILEKHGIKHRVVGKIEKQERTGAKVHLDGTVMYYSGR